MLVLSLYVTAPRLALAAQQAANAGRHADAASEFCRPSISPPLLQNRNVKP